MHEFLVEANLCSSIFGLWVSVTSQDSGVDSRELFSEKKMGCNSNCVIAVKGGHLSYLDNFPK